MRASGWIVAGMCAALSVPAFCDPPAGVLEPGYYRGTMPSGLGVELSVGAPADKEGKFEASWRCPGRGWTSLAGSLADGGSFSLAEGSTVFLEGSPAEERWKIDVTLAGWAGPADEAGDPPDISDSLRALDSDDPAERDRAEAALARLARERQVREALDDAASAEVRARLGHLLDRQVTLTRIASFQQADWRSGDGTCTAAARTVRLPGADLRLREWAADLERETMERVRDSWSEFLAELENEDDAGARDRSYEELWSLEFAATGMVSLRALVSQYAGGAHGNYGYRTVTARLQDDRVHEVALADWFRADAAWAEVLCPAVFEALKEDGAGWIENGDMTEITVDDLSLWTVTPEGLTFTFEPYRMGCYAEGTHEILIPWTMLDPLVDREGPFADLHR